MTDNISSWSNLTIAGKAALAANGSLVAVSLFSMGAALRPLEQDFAGAPGSALLVQLIGVIVGPVFAFTSPFTGRMVKRFGIRPAYITSILLIAGAGAGPALCSNLYAILALRVLLAIAVAFGLTAAMSGIARLPEGQRPLLLGLNTFLGGLLCLPLFPLVGFLAEQSWRAAFLVHLVALPVIGLVLALPREEPSRQDAGDAHAGSGSAGLLAGVPPALAIIAALGGLVMVASSIYSPFKLATIGVTQPAKVGQLLGLMTLFSLAGSGGFSLLHRLLGLSGVLKLALGAKCLGCLIVGIAHNVPVVVVGMALLGIGVSLFAAAIYAAAIEKAEAGANVPAAMGIITLCMYGSQLAMPVLGGSLGKVAGPAAVYYLLGVAMAVAVLLALMLDRRDGRATGS